MFDKLLITIYLIIGVPIIIVSEVLEYIFGLIKTKVVLLLGKMMDKVLESETDE